MFGNNHSNSIRNYSSLAPASGIYFGDEASSLHSSRTSSSNGSSGCSDNRLLELCNQKSWDSTFLHVQSNPDEATPSSSAYRGIGTTALSLAVRNGAPSNVVKALLDADPDQLLRVRHCRRGTVLHEAIRYRASVDVISYLTETVLRHEELHGDAKAEGATADTTRDNTDRPSSEEDTAAASTTKKTKDESIPILGQVDDLGRTCLHHMADRISREILQGTSRSTTNTAANFYGVPRFTAAGDERNKKMSQEDIDRMFDLCRQMARAYPTPATMTDIDGHTPLVLVLVVPPPGQFVTSGGEDSTPIDRGIDELVRIFVEVAPQAAELSTDSANIMGLHSTATTNALQSAGLRISMGRRCTFERAARARRAAAGTIYVEPTSSAGPTTSTSSKTKGDGKKKPLINFGPNPLYYALIHRRSIPTMEMLLTATPTAGIASCTALVTTDLEVPLHVAVTMRAPTEIIRLLLHHGPEAAAAGDKYALTPLDWLWMRHVLDKPFLEAQGDDDDDDANDRVPVLPPFMPSKPSSRRYIPKTYLQSWNDAAEEIESLTEAMKNNNKRRSFHQAFRNYRVGAGALWERASMMLPCAARAVYQANNRPRNVIQTDEAKCSSGAVTSSAVTSSQQKWPVVHAAAYVPCPRPLLDLAIYYYPDQVCEKDSYGRLPIHYAVSRPDHDLTYDLPDGMVQNLTAYIRAKHRRPSTETSPVFELVKQFPEGCRIADPDNRLPLHLALDMIKENEGKGPIRYRADHDYTRANNPTPVYPLPTHLFHSSRPPCNSTDKATDAHDAGRSIIRCLLAAHNAAFECKDSSTCLYPFMQAAVGSGADVDLIYMLLRDHPSLCMSFHTADS